MYTRHKSLFTPCRQRVISPISKETFGCSRDLSDTEEYQCFAFQVNNFTALCTVLAHILCCEQIGVVLSLLNFVVVTLSVFCYNM